jgi:hypothetical protein
MLNYFKQPKTKALYSTILLVLGVTLAIEGALWLVFNYGRELMAITVVLSMAWLTRSIYESFLEKYNKQNKKEDASN